MAPAEDGQGREDGKSEVVGEKPNTMSVVQNEKCVSLAYRLLNRRGRRGELTVESRKTHPALSLQPVSNRSGGEI